MQAASVVVISEAKRRALSALPFVINARENVFGRNPNARVMDDDQHVRGTHELQAVQHTEETSGAFCLQPGSHNVMTVRCTEVLIQRNNHEMHRWACQFAEASRFGCPQQDCHRPEEGKNCHSSTAFHSSTLFRSPNSFPCGTARSSAAPWEAFMHWNESRLLSQQHLISRQVFISSRSLLQRLEAGVHGAAGMSYAAGAAAGQAGATAEALPPSESGGGGLDLHSSSAVDEVSLDARAKSAAAEQAAAAAAAAAQQSAALAAGAATTRPPRDQLEEKLKLAAADYLAISEDALAMFEGAYSRVLERVGGEAGFAPPKEIVWLNGAPGAGKGANTPFILQTRGFEARAIQVSDLLAGSQEASAIMQSGGLVSDSMVLELVLQRILTLGKTPVIIKDGDHSEHVVSCADGQGTTRVAGAIVDGFPRTTVQVDFIKLLHDRLMWLHRQHEHTPLEPHFPRPIFRIAVLYVEEEESVRRQLARGRAAIAHNQRVRDSGIGELQEVRPTDLCEKSARRRYHIFKQHYDTLLRLKAFFPFHLIDGMGTLSECREQIEKELQYQSALELNSSTFQAISHIPLSSDIARTARQNMVARLDHYQAHESQLFRQVIDVIDMDVMPIIRRSALSGIAIFNTENPIFFESPVAAEMLADILSERGYYVTWQKQTREIPLRIDSETNTIICTRRTSKQFRIEFERPHIRSSNTSSLLVPRISAASIPFARPPKGDALKTDVKSLCSSLLPDGTPGCLEEGRLPKCMK